MPAFSLRHFAIGFSRGFLSMRHSLLSFKPPGFPPGQFATAHALTDASLLTMFAPVNARRGLCERSEA
jgi:hypothetical protein